MECDRQDVALADRHDALIRQPGQHLHTGTHALNYGRPNEDRVDRTVAQDRHGQIRLEGVELAAERVPVDRHVDEREDGLFAAGDLSGQDDHPGARTQDRGAGTGQGHDRLAQTPPGDELAHGRAFAARKDQAGDPVEVAWQPHGNGFDADRPKGPDMLDDGAVERQYADLHDALRVRIGSVRPCVPLRGATSPGPPDAPPLGS